MTCNLEVFRGMNFGGEGWPIASNLTLWKQTGRLYGFYWTKNPNVATIFAANPKNEDLHNVRVTHAMMRAEQRGADVYGLDPSWLEIWLDDKTEEEAAGLEWSEDTGEQFGLIVRGIINGTDKVDHSPVEPEHLLEQQVVVHNEVRLTHVGTISQEMPRANGVPVWLPIGQIPLSEFATAETLWKYLMENGRIEHWESDRVPIFILFALQEEGGGEVYNELVHSDIWTAWCELVPKYERHRPSQPAYPRRAGH